MAVATPTTSDGSPTRLVVRQDPNRATLTLTAPLAPTTFGGGTFGRGPKLKGGKRPFASAPDQQTHRPGNEPVATVLAEDGTVLAELGPDESETLRGTAVQGKVYSTLPLSVDETFAK